MTHTETQQKINVTIDLIDYTFTQKGNKFYGDNFCGLNGIDLLKRKNSFGEAAGEFKNFFEISIDEEEGTLEYKILPELLNLCNNDKEEALMDAIRTTLNYYDDIGWEFLSDIKE